MDSKTASKLRNVINEKLAVGDMGVNKILKEPKNEVELIKRKLCEPFIDFFNASSKNGDDMKSCAEKLSLDKKEFVAIVHYDVEGASLDKIFQSLVNLSKIDQNAKRVLLRIIAST